ncbi:hypothetical protein GCM10009795_096860 [Nocardioides hankookensis]|uniref:Uncharacterized protein n=1 Tax=Nocardioides hankookensis TaxID=443157 RepID=A0ABW1LNT4_9ACTN
MTDLDQLTDRLRELGQRAPYPAPDPGGDIRRGRAALRRSHVRRAAGVTTALAAVGVAAASLAGPMWPGSDETGLQPADRATVAIPTPNSTASSSGSSSAANKCKIPRTPEGRIAMTPAEASALTTYREAAAAVLDPSGKHLDRREIKRSESMQPAWTCDPKTGLRLIALGTTIGWRGGGGLGSVRVEVASAEKHEPLQVVLNHSDWVTYRGQLPAGVRSARVANDNEDGGHAVVAERSDGLTIALEVAGVWSNNVAPGSPAATDLPGIGALLTLAASPQLTFPES